MSSPSNQSKDIWLHLLKVGEWQTTNEIRAALDGIHLSNAAATMDDMTQSGTVILRKQDGRNRYAVTTACKVPRGTTMRELMQAMQAPAAATNDISSRRAAA